MKIPEIDRIEKKIQYLPDKELYDYALQRRYALLQAAAFFADRFFHTGQPDVAHAVDMAELLLAEIERRER